MLVEELARRQRRSFKEPQVDRDSLNRWIDLYERAWRAEGTALVRDIFAADATYRTAPYEKPFRGLDAIAKMWDEERDSHETFEMSHQIVAVEGNTGVAFVEVLYKAPLKREYRDLWIVRFDRDGRCVAFEEWPFWPPGQHGGWIDGPKE